MSGRDETQREAIASIDFGALELEIEREIDSMFVPAGLQPAQTAPAATNGKNNDAPPPGVGFANEGPEASQGPNADFSASVTEVDKEKDSMLEVKEETASVNAPTPPKTFTAAGVLAASAGPASHEAGEDATARLKFDEINAEIEKEIDNLFVPAIAGREAEANQATPPLFENRVSDPVSREEEAPGSEAAGAVSGSESGGQIVEAAPRDSGAGLDMYVPNQELPRLVEIFNVAYLSLDWEFSLENLRKLQAALDDLKPFAVRSADSVPLFKILNAVLQRLMLKPQAANGRLIELIRDSQSLLAHLLLLQGESGTHEKERLKSLVDRFQEMRQRALALKTEAKKRSLVDATGSSGEAAVDRVSSGRIPVQQPPPEHVSTHEASDSHTDGYMPGDLRAWMEDAFRSMSENLAAIELEIERVRRIEAVLLNKPALLPLANRLSESRNRLAARLKDLEEVKRACTDRTALSEQTGKTSPEGGDTGWSDDSAKVLSHGTTAAVKNGGSRLDQTRQQDIYTCCFSGETFAISADNIVKAGPVSRKKVLRILKKRHATLADFKPPFRSVKTGVLGEWTRVPDKEIKEFRFEPVSCRHIQPADFLADSYIAVLASNGDKHGVIFAEKTSFVENAAIHPAEAGGSCDTFDTVDGRSVLFGLEQLFSQTKEGAPGESIDEKSDRSC